MDGRRDDARSKLASTIRKLRKRGALEAKDELEDMQFDGEMMVRSGVDAEFGVLLLEAVVTYGYGDDLTDFAVDRSESILQVIRKAEPEDGRRAPQPPGEVGFRGANSGKP
jgi:hypothetical protein